MSGLFKKNKIDQQIVQKIQEATASLQKLQEAIYLLPTYNADFFNIIEDLKKKTADLEQYKRQDSSDFTTEKKQKLLEQLQQNINSINKTIEDVQGKANIERAQQASQSESEWVLEVIELNKDSTGEHNKRVDDYIKQLTELQSHDEQLFFQHYKVPASFLEKKLKKSGAEKILTQKKELLIQNLLSIPKEQKNEQFNAYIQYLRALQQEANRIINTEADAIRIIQNLEKQLKQINPTLLNEYQGQLKKEIKELLASKQAEEQIDKKQAILMDAYEQQLKSTIQKMYLQQEIDRLDTNMLSSLENNRTVNKDDYDTLVHLISNLENKLDNVTFIRNNIQQTPAYKDQIPAWAQQNHDIPALEQLNNNDIDYLSSYALSLVSALNQQQQEEVVVDYQLFISLNNLSMFMNNLPTYDFFKALNIYKLIVNQINAILKGTETGEEKVKKKQQLFKIIASFINAYKTNSPEPLIESIDFEVTLKKLNGLSSNSEEFKNDFKKMVYMLEVTLELLEEPASTLLAQHKEKLFKDLISADFESEKSILINYLKTLQQEIVNSISEKPLETSQETLPNSLRAESQQDISIQQLDLDSSSMMSINTAPTSPTTSSKPSSAPSLQKEEESERYPVNNPETTAPILQQPTQPTQPTKVKQKKQYTVRPLSPEKKPTPEEIKQSKADEELGLSSFMISSQKKELEQQIKKQEEQIKKQEEQMQVQHVQAKQQLENHEKEMRDKISENYQETRELLYKQLQNELTKQLTLDHENRRQELVNTAMSTITMDINPSLQDLEKLVQIAQQLQKTAVERTLMLEQHKEKVTDLFTKEEKSAELLQQIKSLEKQLSEGTMALTQEENIDREKIVKYAQQLKIIAEQLTQAQQDEKKYRSILEQEAEQESKQLFDDINKQRMLQYQKKAAIIQQESPRQPIITGNTTPSTDMATLRKLVKQEQNARRGNFDPSMTRPMVMPNTSEAIKKIIAEGTARNLEKLREKEREKLSKDLKGLTPQLNPETQDPHNQITKEHAPLTQETRLQQRKKILAGKLALINTQLQYTKEPGKKTQLQKTRDELITNIHTTEMELTQITQRLKRKGTSSFPDESRRGRLSISATDPKQELSNSCNKKKNPGHHPGN